MTQKTIRIESPDRTYRIPELVQLACRFRSKIRILCGDGQFDVKSIMGMMALDPTAGPLALQAEGPDEQMALDALCAFLTE